MAGWLVLMKEITPQKDEIHAVLHCQFQHLLEGLEAIIPWGKVESYVWEEWRSVGEWGMWERYEVKNLAVVMKDTDNPFFYDLLLEEVLT